MKQIPLAEIEENLAEYLRQAEAEDIVILRDGKPVGVIVGFKSEEDWAEYQIETDVRFLKRIASALESVRAGKGIRIEDLPE